MTKPMTEKERLRYGELIVKEILSDFGFSSHPQGVEIVGRLNELEAVLSGFAQEPAE